MKPAAACFQCGATGVQVGRFCNTCRLDRAKGSGQRRAIAAVNIAVALGEIPRAADLVCLDCGVQANCYDHRDYAKPYVIEPVCWRCNSRRGPGKWVKYAPLCVLEQQSAARQ